MSLTSERIVYIIGGAVNTKKLAVALTAAMLFLLMTISSEAQEKIVPKEDGKAISELGIVYKGMPKGYLENAGFTKYLLISSKIQGNKEWLTFSDWTTHKSGDTITFIIENGRVQDWIRTGEKTKKPKQNI